MSSQLTEPKQSPLVEMGNRYHIDPLKLLAVLKATAIKGSKDRPATTEELTAFCLVANQYGLNPLTREIHAFVGKSGDVVPIVGIDGWVKIVNRQPNFNGCDFEYIEDERGTVVGITCSLYCKGREHPVKVTEWLQECRRDTIPWNTMPRRMLRHKAYMQCARICFGLSGIFDEDEAQDILSNSMEPAPAAPPLGKGSTKVKAVPTPQDNPDDPNGLAIQDYIRDTTARAKAATTDDDLQLLRDEIEQNRQWLGEQYYSVLISTLCANPARKVEPGNA